MSLGPEASQLCARGVFTMTKLQILKIINVTLDDGFFSVMSQLASQSKVKPIFCLYPTSKSHIQIVGLIRTVRLMLVS